MAKTTAMADYSLGLVWNEVEMVTSSKTGVNCAGDQPR